VADADIIVIGAGAAGLAAACKLHRGGAKVIVLEARGRIGGRILTQHDAGGALPIELGAEFVHGRPPATFNALQAFNLEATEAAARRLISEAGALEPLDDFYEIVAAVDEQINPQVDMPYAQFLKSAKASAFQKRVAKSYVEGFNAARADVISAAAVALSDRAAEGIEGERQFRLPSGYQALAQGFANQLPANCVRIEHVVRAVKWNRREVEVYCRHPGAEERLRAGCLITTVPLGLLRSAPDEHGGILFDRPLAAKAAALARLEIGHVVKVVMHFRERFWEEPRIVGSGPDFGFAHCFDSAFETWWTTQPWTMNRLTGWAAGPAAEKLLGRSPDELCALAITSIAETFRIPPAQVGAQFVEMHFHDWAADPFARGAYSYPAVGGIEAAQTLAEPLDETLFFAGEATDFQGFSGTVHGAIESGYRAASEVLAAN
jgi:monoamine oxidase